MVGEDETELKNLSRVNIFIGRNNSGKSRFIRLLFGLKGIEFKSTDFSIERYGEAIEAIRDGIDSYFSGNLIKNIRNLQSNKFVNKSFLSKGFDNGEVKKYLDDFVSNRISSFEVSGYKGGRQLTGERIHSEIVEIIKEHYEVLSELSIIKMSEVFRESLYFPSLRGLRGFPSDEIDLYCNRTVKDYFDGSQLDKSIFTGLTLYQDVKRLLLGPSRGRLKIKAFEKFLSESFFDGEDVDIIPNIEDTVVHVKIGDNEERPIYELGDGIQAIIILTYPLFFRQGEKLNICIEEPDLFLHPGFQRIFLQTICDKRFESFQFFLTTHSNHFLDMTLDYSQISVYSFTKKDTDRFLIENVSHADSRVLEEIGVRNASVFLSNCTIWVEGITDRIYLRKYLELYQSTLKAVNPMREDVHYSFVEYGGGNITHWSFLDDADDEHPNINIDRLCGKVFLIADRDGTDITQAGKTKKYLRIAALEERLGDRFYCLRCREIENLLSPSVLKKVVNELEKEKVDWKSFSQDDYASQPLGKWLESGKKVTLNRSYAAESGTLKDKVAFAKRAVSQMDSFDDLSEEAKVLTNRIHDFIRSKNT